MNTTGVINWSWSFLGLSRCNNWWVIKYKLHVMSMLIKKLYMWVQKETQTKRLSTRKTSPLFLFFGKKGGRRLSLRMHQKKRKVIFFNQIAPPSIFGSQSIGIGVLDESKSGRMRWPTLAYFGEFSKKLVQ
jgi:hypothetical protein